MALSDSSPGVLVVEDDLIIALAVEEMLAELRFERIHLAHDLPAGQAILRTHRLELAILDVNIGTGLVFPLAAEIRSENVPFVFATGRSHNEFPTEWTSYPIVPKPMTASTLSAAIAKLGVVPVDGRKGRAW